MPGFAPVGCTDYLVLVQSREPADTLLPRLAAWTGGAPGGGLTLLAVGLGLLRGRSRKGR